MSVTRCVCRATWVLTAAASFLTLPSAVGAERLPVVLDTDIGSDIDDAFALALVLASPELELRGVTTVGRAAEDRAWLVCRFLEHSGHPGIPVAWGRDPQPDYGLDDQIQYRRHPAVIFNRAGAPVKTPAVDFLLAQLQAAPGRLTVIAVGPLTNIARLLKRHPRAKEWVREIVVMGGALRVGYNAQPPPVPEWNIRADIDAARTVLGAGVPLTLAPLESTAHLQLNGLSRRRLFAASTRLTLQLQGLYQLWGKPTPVLFDPVAVALVMRDESITVKELRVAVDDRGLTRVDEHAPLIRVATATKRDAFVKTFVERIASFGPAALPPEPVHRSSLVERGGLPERVHVVEDYETDIERRWWLSGKLESANVPPGSRRACRGVVTQDFDAKQGQLRTGYSAVVFNPVPGPPMGPNTRLSFRYWLRGTDTLRVQLYSLSRGFHRYTSVRGLQQGSWQSATVDMTAMRRPDGSGGALAADERIDDIQFYVDPRAELIIDDIVLYEAAPAGERRPFPKRVIFCGWFDTGRQGTEWPGEFEIVKHAPPRKWKAAKSVKRTPGDGDRGADAKSWIRIHLRGRRGLGEKTRVRFRYRLSARADIEVALVDGASRGRRSTVFNETIAHEWSELTLALDAAGKPQDSARDSGGLDAADELQLQAPGGVELLVDDVLIYEPGQQDD